MGNGRWPDVPRSDPTWIASADVDEGIDAPPLGRSQDRDEEPAQELPRVSRMTVRL